MCSSALENASYSLENYTVKYEQFDQLQFVTPKKTFFPNLIYYLYL